MKKNFLFGTLAVLLAGFWFGGASLATDLPCEVDSGAVACIGETGYTSLGLAVSGANDGDTIKLINNDSSNFSDTKYPGVLIISKSLTIDGGGYFVQGITNANKDNMIYIAGSGTVTIENITLKDFGGGVKQDGGHVIAPIFVHKTFAGKLILSGVNFNTFNWYAVQIKGGEFEVNNCNITGTINDINNYQQGIIIDGNASGTINNTRIINTKDYEGTKWVAGAIVFAGGGNVTVSNTTIRGVRAIILSPSNTDGFSSVSGSLILGEGNDFEGTQTVLEIDESGVGGYTATSSIKITDGSYSGSIEKSDLAVVSGAKFEIEGGTFSEPVLKAYIPTEGKCTVKNTDGTYGIGDCPKSIIRHDSDSDLEGTSRDATVSVNGYNVEVSGPINFYNKGNNQGANRYGLEIVSEGFDSNLTGGAMFTLDGAHWSNRTGDLELGEFGHPNSFFFYPKLTAGNKNTPLSVTLNWGPYYEPETFTINHSAAVLKTGITIMFDTDGGDAIDDLVFSGADLTMPDDTGADLKVGDIVASKTGYTFLYWSLPGDDAVYDTGSKVETDITLKANYTGNEISLTFSVDGTDTVLTGKAGDPFVTAPTLSKSCYNGSWSPALPDTIPAVATTYTAQWSYNCGSSGGGGSKGSSASSASTTDTKADTAKADEAKADETKAEETKGNEDNGTNNGNDGTPAPESKYSQEMIDAYNWAFKNGITTMPTIEEANMEGKLTRIAMAKMLSFFAINVLGKTPDTDRVVPSFPDVDAQLDKDYDNGVTLAYQLGIMGIGIEEFRPNDEVTRGEFATALSRLLFNTPDGEGAFYEPHLAKLMEEKIITVDTPDLKELRGYVMIMLMRSAMEK